jgi:hypothetical protein
MNEEQLAILKDMKDRGLAGHCMSMISFIGLFKIF